jgi:hypothetical protein
MTVTSAPATTAPEASFTVPEICDVACAKTPAQHPKNNALMMTNCVKVRFMVPPGSVGFGVLTVLERVRMKQ